MKRIIAIFIARNLEFFRDRGTFLWNIFLPVFLVFGFAFAFSGKNAVSYKVGTVGTAQVRTEFQGYRHLKFLPYASAEPALKKLTHHQIDMVLDFNESRYYINTESQNGYLVERILLSDRGQSLRKATVSGRRIRYIDWFIPGVIGMNILFGCLTGVGFVIVRYRKNGVLKRFKATPLRAIEFVSAQILSRFFIVVFMAVVVYAATDLFLHFSMYGSWFLLLLTLALAILCHIAMGLLLSARFRSEEVAGGILNFITFPMMIVSGIFFSLEGTPRFMQAASQVFPITHFVEACRKIMLDGAGFPAVAANLGMLAGTTVLFLVLAAAIFKWE